MYVKKKWHLGHTAGCFPTAQGFDEWYGIPNSTDEAYWPDSRLFRPTSNPYAVAEQVMEGRKGETPKNVKVYDLAERRAIDRQRQRLHVLPSQSRQTKRLHYIPGVGPMLATALVASVPDPSTFRSGRNFSAWIGLVPKQHSSGGKEWLGSISKQGDRYLRGLFVAGALAVIRYAKIHGIEHRPWLTALLGRRPTKVAAIALANKIARNST
jgi:hypothetical protein